MRAEAMRFSTANEWRRDLTAPVGQGWPRPALAKSEGGGTKGMALFQEASSKAGFCHPPLAFSAAFHPVGSLLNSCTEPSRASMKITALMGDWLALAPARPA